MIPEKLKHHIYNHLNSEIKTIQSVSGGDISSAYKISTSTNSFFLKVNQTIQAQKMFETEAKALSIILDTQTIKTPKVYAVDSFDGINFILMEFIESQSPTKNDFILFGKQLAELHLVTSQSFGLKFDNFIGNLNQTNREHQNWSDFYIKERLIPQFRLAKQRGLLNISEIPSFEILKKTCDPYFKAIKPSLLHGDLWSGNFIISKGGIPYLIDPASYFGHSEVDIAMSKLFGGFGHAFYESYHRIIPKDPTTKQRIDLYQLYYLLVHLNLFGRSYYGSVNRILNAYF